MFNFEKSPLLHTLWINDCSNIDDNSVDIICHLEHLKELKIGAANISVQGLLKIVSSCNSLCYLDTDGIVLDGNEFRELIISGHSLEILDITGSIINDEDLLQCCEYLKQIKSLIIMDCVISTYVKDRIQNKIPGLVIVTL